MSTYQERAAKLAVEYAQNRIDMAELNKKIASLTDWQREDKGVDLTEIRSEYLDEGDRWRGWLYAIEVVENFHDQELNPITAEQRELAAQLDQKAALRVQAGKIKRGFYALGRGLMKVTP